MPVSRLLVAMRQIQQPGLGKVVADQLQADRQAVNDTAGNRHAGQASQVDGDGVDVGQVHLHRIRSLFAQLECGRRRRRAHDDVAFLERLDEIIGDQPPDALRLQVIGVVIAV